MENIWTDFEGDNWYKRNKERLGKAQDIPLLLTDMYSLSPLNVLEVGAANGFRLAKIYERFKSRVVGLEPSALAVKEGREKYPFITFHEGLLEESQITGSFDLVIVNFVMHWVYRDNLYAFVNKLDSLVSPGGFLIIGDFGPDAFFEREYHHLDRKDVKTWKVPYWNIFLSSGRYLELAKIRFDVDKFELSTNIDYRNMGTAVLLKKQDQYVAQ